MTEPTPPDEAGWRERLRERWTRFRPYAPFVAFVCGFGFDSVTLGRKVSELDLYIVSFYAAAALLAFIVRELPTRDLVNRIATIVLQFCLGGALSAIVVLYFKSAGSPLSMMLMLTLFVVMIGNEYVHREEPPRRDFALALWVVAATMLANFVLPHVAKSLSPLWFYGCAVASAAVLLILRAAFRFPWADLRYALGVCGALVVLWALGFVPPVPLVYKNDLVGTDFTKSDYSCAIDEPSLLQSIGITNTTVSTDGPVYVLTAVFAPQEVEVTMEHRWFHYVDGTWKQTDDMQFDMRGGRTEGWRFWSRKRKPKPGLWRVETALADGPVLGYQKFEVVTADAPKRRQKL